MYNLCQPMPPDLPPPVARFFLASERNPLSNHASLRNSLSNHASLSVF